MEIKLILKSETQEWLKPIAHQLDMTIQELVQTFIDCPDVCGQDMLGHEVWLWHDNHYNLQLRDLKPDTIKQSFEHYTSLFKVRSQGIRSWLRTIFLSNEDLLSGTYLNDEEVGKYVDQYIQHQEQDPMVGGAEVWTKVEWTAEALILDFKTWLNVQLQKLNDESEDMLATLPVPTVGNEYF